MYVAELSLRNFRNFAHAKLVFGPGVNALIGSNGAGKSNAFHALRLLLDSGLSLGQRSLRPTDFNRTIGNYQGNWIIISVLLKNLGTSDALLSLAHGLSTDGSVGRLTYMFHPRSETIEKLNQCTSLAERKKLLEEMSVDDYRWTIRGGGNQDPTLDSAYQLLTPYLTNDHPIAGWAIDQDVFGAPYPHGELAQEVSCTFFNAVRDVERPGRNQRHPLQEILSRIQVSDQTKNDVTAAAKDLNTKLNAANEISNESEQLGRTLRAAAGDLFAPSVSIGAVPPEFDDLFGGLQLFGLEEGIVQPQPVSNLGLGALNLAYMGLRLRTYELLASQGRTANFLLVEEPEAHLHPHIQRTLFRRYHDHHTQVFVTSHSTHIASQCKLSQTNILIRNGGATTNVSPGIILGQLASTVERYLDATRSTLLFANGVILVEGEAELYLIPRAVEKVMGRTLDEMGVSIVSVGGTNFLPFVRLFGGNCIPKSCSVISDLDTPWLDPTHAIAQGNASLRKSQERAHQLGVTRETEIAAEGRSPYVKSFFAPTTFEVELHRTGNAQLLAEVASSQYKQTAKIQEVKNHITGNDLVAAYASLLDVCDDKGKGWIALGVAEVLDHSFRIPEYILRAVAHAANLTRKDLDWLVTHWEKQTGTLLAPTGALGRWDDNDLATLKADPTCPPHLTHLASLF